MRTPFGETTTRLSPLPTHAHANPRIGVRRWPRVYHFFNGAWLKKSVTAAVAVDLALAFFEPPTYSYLQWPQWVRSPLNETAVPIVCSHHNHPAHLRSLTSNPRGSLRSAP